MAPHLNFFLALAAGILSFLSPCILPLIPSYLSLLGGISYPELKEGQRLRSRVLLKTIFFVLGFSFVFILLGILFSGAFGFLNSFSRQVTVVSGILVILLGFNLLFDFWKLLDREKRLHVGERNSTPWDAFLLGMAFGGGWTPCVGPILASILFLVGSRGRILEGAVLLGAYSMGLGIPFLLAGAFFSCFSRGLDRLRPFLGAIRLGSGIFLILIGLLMAWGKLQNLNNWSFW